LAVDHPGAQQAMQRFVAAAETDERIVAMLLLGSRAAGTADEFSDLDLGVVTTDAARDAVIGDRERLVRAIGEALFLEDFGNPANVHAILADGLVLELLIFGTSELLIEEPYRILLDKAELVPGGQVRDARQSEAAPSAEEVRRLVYGFWHDVEHVATALGRGQPLWAHGGLEQLRGTCLKLARLRAGAPREDDEPYWKVDGDLPAHLAAALRATIVPAEPEPMRDAALALVRLYQSLAEPMAAEYGFDYPRDLNRLVTERLSTAG
jgi:predicted nucleotidyltransferase